MMPSVAKSLWLQHAAGIVVYKCDREILQMPDLQYAAAATRTEALQDACLKVPLSAACAAHHVAPY